MKHVLKFALPVLAIVASVACSKNSFEPANPNAGKELISFAGDGNAFTKASLTKAGFSSDTYVQMRVKAEATGKTTRYTEAIANATAEVTNDSHSGLVGAHSDLVYVSGQERYWDDAFGRASKLTVYAFAIPCKTDANLLPAWTQSGWSQIDANTNPNWYEDGDSEDNTISWEVQTAQDTQEKMDIKDLAYSNNISASGKGGLYTYSFSNDVWSASLGDGLMEWRPKTNAAGETTGKFDQGHLVFQHALAWIEINLKEGDGFNNAANTDFTWTKTQAAANQNITLKSFYTKGTFNVSNAAWTAQESHDIVTLNEKTGSNPAAKTTRQLFAYVIPGNNLYTTTANVLEFEIDNAQYYVTGKQIAEAIRNYDYGGTEGKKYAAFESIEAGKHYVINLSVAKKGIDRITAAIVDWETVNSTDADAKNTYPTFDLEDRGTRLTDQSTEKFDLYRAAKTATDYITGNTDKNYAWEDSYTDKAALTWDGTANEWKSGWYWENNLTYYHFRAVGDAKGSNTPTVATGNATPESFAITSGAISGSSYVDYLWGAPFEKNTGKLVYSLADGFDNEQNGVHQISYAIGATESVIKMLLFHVTSQVFVNVKTTTDASKVVLKDNDKLTKVEVLNFLPDGQVLMGNGLVETTSTTRTDEVELTAGTFTAETSTDPAHVDNYSYGFVPQELTWTGGTIGLRITTPDGNQYVVKDLSQCKASVTNTNLENPYNAAGTLYQIDRWYPHYQYTYTVTIKKTGIERITAAVLPWETVTGDLGVIDLEN